jgi:kindlin 2
MRISPEGETLKSWQFSSMKSWNVNWDVKQFEIIFDEDTLTFVCIGFDAKILHEFIGGYIYVSLRSENCNTSSNSSFNDDMFFRLTEKR